MLIFRLICAIMVAWAMNLVMARPEATLLLEAVPDMAVIVPLTGAVVGFFNLAKRQGWGLIVSVVNGMWTGLLTIAISSFGYLALRMFNVVWHNLIKNFEAFLRVLATEAEPLIVTLADMRLMALVIGATAITGILSEVLHWFMVRLRHMRGDDDPKVQVKAAVAKAGGPMS